MAFWEEAELLAEGVFLKWADGPFDLRFLRGGEIEKKHFIDGKPYDCSGEDCEYCSDGVELTINYKFDVCRYPDEATKVFTLSVPAFREMLKVKKQLGEDRFYKAKLKCSREGSGKTIKYSFLAYDFIDDDIPI